LRCVCIRVVWVRNFRSGIRSWDREAMVKDYGVAVAMPQG
jgi:hypothetical protein